MINVIELETMILWQELVIMNKESRNINSIFSNKNEEIKIRLIKSWKTF